MASSRAPSARALARAVPRPSPAAAIGLLAGAAALGAAALANGRAARAAEARHPPTGRFAIVDGVAVHYLEEGEGPPVLLLHGNGAMGEDWRVGGLLGHLSRRHRVLAPDRPGFGYTDRPRGRAWTARAQADLLAGFLAEVGAERPVVVGHSWGAMAAMALAQRGTPELAGLVLLSGYYYPSARLDVPIMSGPAIPGIGDVMRHTISPPLARLLAPTLIRRVFAPRPVPKRFRRRFPLELCFRPSQIRASAADTALMIPGAASLRAGYAALRLPVRVLAGDGDRLVDHEKQSARLASELPNAELTILPGAGHMTPYGDHDVIAAAVRAVSGS